MAKTASRTFEVQNQLGIHARPASLFVKTATQFECEINVEKVGDGTQVNGKSIMSLMMLAAEEGTKLSVTADGDDAMEALDALGKLFTEKFGED